MNRPASVADDDTLRLFLALRLPPQTIDGLVRWGDESLTEGRRVPPEHLHVTLAFLGARPAGELQSIVGALRAAAAAAAPFELEPLRYRETRSVGMLVLDDPSGDAARLAADLHGLLERLDVYRPEKRRWLPHVTVLRFHERPRLDPPLPALERFTPSDAAAFLSRLHPSGARYEVLETMRLGRDDRRSERHETR
jgi:2'-5' RNA ligase